MLCLAPCALSREVSRSSPALPDTWLAALSIHLVGRDLDAEGYVPARWPIPRAKSVCNVGLNG